jgi:hypothetical protein
MINLDISNDRFIPEVQKECVCVSINAVLNILSNIAQIKCNLTDLNELLLLLECSKLSILKLDKISYEIYRWLQSHQSKLNVYINFNWVDYGNNMDNKFC